MANVFANSGDPDQTPHSAASDLGLHYLPITLFVVSGLNGLSFIQLTFCLNLYRIILGQTEFMSGR